VELFVGSSGNFESGDPPGIKVKLIPYIQPAPAMVVLLFNSHAPPSKFAAAPPLPPVQVVVAVLIVVLLALASHKPRALLIVLRSDNLWLSLACLNNSAGFKTKATTVAKIAKMPMTISNSNKVNPCFGFIKYNLGCLPTFVFFYYIFNFLFLPVKNSSTI
jgi:hypothetical protein